ncbi:MAG: hypothetical protein ACKVQK_07390, partial [Burkholderiales bacterium]
GAPLSYLGGERLGALQILDRDAALWALGLGWALLAPLLLILARRWNGYGDSPNAGSLPEVRHA